MPGSFTAVSSYLLHPWYLASPVLIYLLQWSSITSCFLILCCCLITLHIWDNQWVFVSDIAQHETIQFCPYINELQDFFSSWIWVVFHSLSLFSPLFFYFWVVSKSWELLVFQILKIFSNILVICMSFLKKCLFILSPQFNGIILFC